jgi:peptide-methionine (S)-S-oxide reductase
MAKLRDRILVGAGLLLAVGAVTQVGMPAVAVAAETAVKVPAPAYDPAVSANQATAVFAGGCFWGVQGVYSHVKGVTNAISGYAGGARQTAHYEQVGSGTTGHAEAVRVTYDPRVVSYGKLLQIYFSVVADPTTLNYRGPDHGSQQKAVAERYIAQLNKAGAWNRPIVTKIEKMPGFYPAEDYHQDFFARNPRHPYIVVNDAPKVDALKKMYAADYRDKPVLVASR